MAAYTAGFMTHVTCRLTAKNRDQLRNPMLGNRVWVTFTFFSAFLSLDLFSLMFTNIVGPLTRGGDCAYRPMDPPLSQMPVKGHQARVTPCFRPP